MPPIQMGGIVSSCRFCGRMREGLPSCGNGPKKSIISGVMERMKQIKRWIADRTILEYIS